MKLHTDTTIAAFWTHKATGITGAAAARLAGVDPNTAGVWNRGEYTRANKIRDNLIANGLTFAVPKPKKEVAQSRSRLDDERIKTFWRTYFRTGSVTLGAEESGISYKHCRSIAQGKVAGANQVKLEMVANENLMRGPVAYGALRAEAKKAHDDFGYFRVRYMGRAALPWQSDAANKIRAYLEGEQNDPFEINYLLLNCPPGSGKSTLLRDICCWLIVRNRSIRIMWGSRTEGQAAENVELIRDVLGSPLPIFVSDGDKQRRGAVDPTGCLADDFGSFKPANRGNWGSDGFTVSLPDDAVGSNKEQTMTAFGAEGDALGRRVDIAVWDDLADDANIRTAVGQQKIRDTLDNKLEYRVEPGGLFCLVGQRLSPTDIYGYARDKRAVRFDEHGDEVETEAPVYHHIIYPAHDESRCAGVHTPGQAKAWPDGCLLDPRALSWARLRKEMTKNDATYRVVFQQEDLDPEHVLVKKVWIDGGTDTDGSIYHGCYDDDRAPWTRPKAEGTYWTALTVDPSGTRMWAVQAWAFNQRTKDRFLIGTFAGRMTADQLLDATPQGQFVGLLEDYAQALSKIGLPPGHVIIENNAAQRYLMDFDHFKRWSRFRRVLPVRHATTGTSKLDPDRGVETLRGVWRHSQVRLPGTIAGRQMVAPLVREAMTYPVGATSDQLMAQWFFEWHLPLLGKAKRVDPTPLRRPSWLDGPDRRAPLRSVRSA